MENKGKTRGQLSQELTRLRQRIAELEAQETERKQMEEALREREERLSQIIQGSSIATHVIDNNHVITHCNKAFENLTGIPTDEVIGTKKQWAPFYPKERPVMSDLIADNVPEEEIIKYYGDKCRESALIDGAYEAEDFFPHMGKRGKWLLFTAAPLRDIKGKVIGAIETLQDITERRQAEEALKEYSERLEVMVEERTRELRDAQEELVRKEKLAILGQLAGGVGHDLRNPLGAIKNAAYFLNMVLKEPDPEVKKTLEILEKEVGTSERIISSLLDFARAKPPTKRKISVNEILQETLSRIAVPGNIEVAQQLDDTLPKILADPDQVAQVFANVILNGIQAMTEGGQLTINSNAPALGRVSVSITDTGVGIPEEQLKKLFEPLYTSKAKGIGLGLAIVKTLVEGHGGTIEVESEPGKGSTFTVKLPTGTEESNGAGEQGR